MATMTRDLGGDGTVSIGRIFSRAFSFAFRYPAITFGSAFLFGALPSILSQFLTFMRLSSAETVDNSVATGVVALQFILGVVSLVFSGLMQATITRGLVVAHEGGRPTFGQCLSQGLRYAIWILLFYILWTIAVAVGFMLLIIPGIMLVCMWAVAIPALVEERTGIIGAFGRSRELTRGHRWKVFGLLAVIIVSFYLAIILMAVVGLAGVGVSSMVDSANGPSITLIVYSAISGLLFGLLWATIQPALFVELRDAKEGGGAGELEQVFS